MINKPQFTRFNDLTEESIRMDCQIHTTWTDGNHSAEEIIKQAIQLGLKRIAFTEHIRKTSDYFSEFFVEIDQLRQNYAFPVHIGVETKVLNTEGDLDISDQDFNKAEIILGSVHRIAVKDKLVHPRDLGARDTFKNEYELSLGMIKSKKIDVLAHPAGMSIRNYGDFPEEFLATMIRLIAKTDIAFEISGKYTNPSFLDQVIRYCREYNPFVSIGSDVHDINDLGKSWRMLEEKLWSTV